MIASLTSTKTLPDLIEAAPQSGRRKLIGLAGAPASGKSTLAETLAREVSQRGKLAKVVPMDGFHLDNRILSEMGLSDRKGSPDSFDAAGLLRLLPALRFEEEVYYPIFDRAADISIAGAGQISGDCDVVIVEGNYLLYDHPVWRDLADQWDMSVRLDVPMPTLEARLRQRWADHGVPARDAEKRIISNDLVNARAVEHAALPASVVVHL